MFLHTLSQKRTLPLICPDVEKPLANRGYSVACALLNRVIEQCVADLQSGLLDFVIEKFER